jgi:pilus assembly protein CpaF
MRQQISSAIQIVIQVARLSDGSRKVTSISEITGMEGEVITMQEIFCFEQIGVGEKGQVTGRFRATGCRPKFLSRLKRFGIEIPTRLFDPARVYETTDFPSAE